MLGYHQRPECLLEWLTLCPVRGRRPQISQILDIFALLSVRITAAFITRTLVFASLFYLTRKSKRGVILHRKSPPEGTLGGQRREGGSCPDLLKFKQYVCQLRLPSGRSPKAPQDRKERAFCFFGILNQGSGAEIFVEKIYFLSNFCQKKKPFPLNITKRISQF